MTASSPVTDAPSAAGPAALSVENPVHGDNACGWLYTGEVYHRRQRPREHTLRYRVFSLLLDIDRISELASQMRWFSRNRLNLVSFYDKDFGGEGSTEPRSSGQHSMRAWVSEQLAAAGLNPTPASVLLSCYPRILGYAFNPLSLYYCRDASGSIYAIVHEVHNTFGERHAYVLPVSQPAPLPSGQGEAWIAQDTEKALFVSPFADMNLHYRFRLNAPAHKQVVVIRAEDGDGVLITASYVATRSELNATSLLKCVLSMPLMTWKVIVGIHYEALKLWLKRVPWFSHIPKHQATIAQERGNEPTPPA